MNYVLQMISKTAINIFLATVLKITQVDDLCVHSQIRFLFQYSEPLNNATFKPYA